MEFEISNQPILNLKIIMKKFRLMPAMLICMMIVLLSSCTVVGGIFKAGVWVGVLGIVILVVIIFWIISKAGKK